jgi:tetratricopeptide (TPR) repeat protein
LGTGLNPHHAMGDPTPEQIRACLARMLSSPQFNDSPQLSSFLSFIVDETIQGRGGDLKGYSIATLALNRPTSFDPQTDPIVRVQAGRLRQAMAEYEAAFPDDTMVITLDKGFYAPKFVLRDLSTATAALPLVPPGSSRALSDQASRSATRPSRFLWTRKRSIRALVLALAATGLAFMVGTGVYILRGGSIGGSANEQPLAFDRFAPSIVVEADAVSPEPPDLAGLAQRTRDAVARFDDIVVVHDIADMVSTTARPSQPRPGSLLTLRISAINAANTTIRFNARLVDQADQTLLWSREFDPVPAGPQGDGARTKIVQAISTAIAQPYGVIHAHVRNRLASSLRKDDPYGCIVSGFDYWRTNDNRNHGIARDCLIQRIRQFPGISSLHAQLTYLYLEEYRQGYNPLPGNPLDRALESANRAATLAPASARSHQALLAAHFARGEMESAWRAANEAIALNPFDTEILADVGARHVQSGYYEKGLGMLQQALELNPSPPTWALTFRAAAHYLLDQNDQARRIASALGGSEYPLAMMALIMVARKNLDESSGRKTLADMQRLHSAILGDPAAYLKRLAFDEGTITRLVKDFTGAREWVATLP